MNDAIDKGSTNEPDGRQAPAWLARLLDSIDRLGMAGGVLAALALTGLTLLILLEIAFRLASRLNPDLPPGMPNAWEFSSYLMGVAFMGGAALTLRAGAHIRVSVLIANVPAAAQRVLECFACTIGLLMSGFLAWSLVLFTWASYVRGQTSMSSDTPIWIPEAAVTLGAVLLALQMLARLLQALWGLPLELPHLKATGASE